VRVTCCKLAGPLKRVARRTRREGFMMLTKRSGLCLLFIVWIASVATTEAQSATNSLHLGFSACSPAVFFPLEPGLTIKLSEITYADVTIAGKTYRNSGMLKFFKEEILGGRRSPTTLLVTVALDRWKGVCSSLAYSAMFGSQTLQSSPYETFDAGKLANMIAFSSEEDSGVFLGGGALEKDLVTGFGYDAKGRRQIRRQTFGVAKVKYEVVYSDYTYSGPPTGKLSGFTARIAALKP